MKQYILKPTMTLQTLTPTSKPHKAPVLAARPPHQPLPAARIDPDKPLLKLGLDVHLELIMAGIQQEHSNPKSPRKFTPQQAGSLRRTTCH